jgi:hypothetical protein
VVANPARDRRALEHPGGLAQRQSLPCDEAEDLSVGVAQSRERGRELGIADRLRLV